MTFSQAPARMSLFLLALMLPVGVTAMAADAAPVNLKASVFESGQTNTWTTSSSWKMYEGMPYQRGEPGDWQELLLNYGITDSQPSGRYNLDYTSTISAFNAFKQDIGNQPTLWTWWLRNQLAVFDGKGTLVPPPTKNLRLKQEYDYHVLAQRFHNQPELHENYDDSFLKAARAIAYDKGHPRQKDAARTLVRALQTRNPAAAWDEVERFRTTPATRDIYPYIEDLRFILMSNDGGYQRPPYTADLREKMLAWLIGVIDGTDQVDARVTPALRADLTQRRMTDALHHLDLYLASPRPLDWWLDTGDTQLDPRLTKLLGPRLSPLLSPRLIALKRQIARHEALAWLQANNINRLTPYEWLYEPEDSGMAKETAHIATYALTRYTQGHGREWLLQAAELARPEQPDFKAILQAAQDGLRDDLYVSTDPKLQVRLWQATVWMQVQAGDLDGALATFGMTQIRNLSRPDMGRYSYSYEFLSKTTLEVMNWYIHRGDYDSARRMLSALQPNPYSFKPASENSYDRYLLLGNSSSPGLVGDMVILAQTPEELYAALGKVHDFRDDVIAPVVNMLPAQALYEFVINQKDLDPKNKVVLLRLVVTRAWLLNDTELMKKAALQLDKHVAGGEKELLGAMDGDATDRLKYMLSHPRMRPMLPFFKDGWEEHYQYSVADLAIDSDNPNDNNWWCSYKPDGNRASLAFAWTRVPFPPPRTYPMRYKTREAPAQFAAARDTAVAQHPLLKLVDASEQARLAAIPQAPQYLTEATLGLNTKRTFFGLWSSSDKRLPEMLHLAVRTTRYGCSRDGSHQSYSFKAYRALQKDYPDSIWATATPYWFSNPRARD